VTGGTHPPGDDPLGPLVARTEGLQPWRRLFHAGSGTAAAAGMALLHPPRAATVGIVGALLLAALTLDALRLAHPSVNRVFFRLLRPLASPREAAGIASSTWFLLGILLTAAFFPVEVAVPAILVLAWADPAASYVGRRWGRRPLGKGTVLGSFTFALVAAGVLVPFVGPAVGIATAIVVASLEAFVGRLDDNLLIPLAAGAVAWSLMPYWS
jgi:dolichol kinase